MRFPNKKRIFFSVLLILLVLGLSYFIQTDNTIIKLSQEDKKSDSIISNVEDTRDILYDKSYNDTTKTITIKRNSTGDVMLYLRLISPEHKVIILAGENITYGYKSTNETLFEFEVIPIEQNMQNFLSGMDTYLETEDNRIISNKSLDIHFQWREKIGQTKVDDYTESCNNVTVNNATFSGLTTVCTLVKSGSHFEPIYRWNDFNASNFAALPKETVLVRGIGDVYLGERVEWHLKLFDTATVKGVLIDEWADYSTYKRYEYQLSNNSIANYRSAGSAFGQIFTVGITGDNETFTLKGISLLMDDNAKTGTGYMNVTAVDSSNLPTGNYNLARAAYTDTDLGQGNPIWVNNTWSGDPVLEAGGKYAYYWQYVGDIRFTGGYSSLNPYTGGDTLYYSATFTSWLTVPQDFAFIVYGLPYSADSSPTVTLNSPANNSNITNTYTVSFNATFTDDIGLANSTLYIWYNNGTLYNTYFQDNTGNVNLTRNQSVTFPNGIKNEKLKWNYLVFDNSSSNAGKWGATNFTLNMSYNLLVKDFVLYPINSSGGNVSGFTSANLREIEKVRLNFTIQAINGIDGDMTLYFTANGTGSCSLGNRQSDFCYNYPLFIQVKNGTVTATYNAGSDGGNQGDSITCQVTGNNTDRQYGCLIDEHYNPNVFKWYKAGYNFSDVKWQSGIQQRITGNNYIRIYFNKSIVPVNADIYKLDARLNYTQLAGLPANLEVYACNSSYVTGDPTATTSCTLAGVRNANEFQDDGTKFRVLATTAILQSIYEVDSFVLLADSVASSKYFSLKTFKATTPGYTTHWEYSTNAGGTWTNLGDGYETEFNINWFYDGGGNSTEALYKIEVTDLAGETMNSSIVHQEWDINATQPYRPIVTIRTPADESIVSGTIDINWTVVERNDDNYLVNITLSNSTNAYLVNNTLYKGTNSVRFNTTIYYDGDYQLTVTAYENETAELLFGNDTHTISIKNLLTPPNVTSLTEYPTEPQEYNPTKVYWFNATVVDLQGVDEVTLEFGGVNYTTNNLSSNYYVSITGLGVGNWNYRWTANDTEGGVNNTETGTYEVTINNSYVLGLTATTPITYGQSTDASESNCPSQLSCTLTPSNAVYGVGASPILFNYSTAGNENYSKSSITTSVTINQDIGLVYAYVNGTRSSISIINGTELNLSAVLVKGIGNIQSYLNETLINNGNPISNMTTFNNVGIYNYTVAYSGNENYTASSEGWTITVSSVPVVTSACNSNITVLKSATQNNRPYGRLCYWLDFR